VSLLIRSSAPKPGPATAFGAVALGAVALGAVTFGGTEPAAPPPDAAPIGATVFAERCAVCHGPQAAGIPGSFPPLHGQVAAFVKIPQGRDYLVMVVTTGLMGSLAVGGANYNGVMPAQSGLSEAEVAAVLSYLASDMGKADSGAAPLSANEVREARTRHPEKSAQATRALRPAADP
jgi:mono/diheme cytochrome c family protein